MEKIYLDKLIIMEVKILSIQELLDFIDKLLKK